MGCLLSDMQRSLDVITRASLSNYEPANEQLASMQRMLTDCHSALTELFAEVLSAKLSLQSVVVATQHNSGVLDKYSHPPTETVEATLSTGQIHMIRAGVTLTEYINGIPYCSKLRVSFPNEEEEDLSSAMLHISRIGEIYVPRLERGRGRHTSDKQGQEGVRRPAATVIGLSSVQDDAPMERELSQKRLKKDVDSCARGTRGHISVQSRVEIPLGAVATIVADGQGCARCQHFQSAGTWNNVKLILYTTCIFLHTMVIGIVSIYMCFCRPRAVVMNVNVILTYNL